MDDRWSWVLCLLRLLTLLPFNVDTIQGGDASRWASYLAEALILLMWAAQFFIGGILFTASTLLSDNFGCFDVAIHRTLLIYNANVLLCGIIFVLVIANVFCLVKMYRRDTAWFVKESRFLFKKAAGFRSDQLLRTANTMKLFLVCVYTLPFIPNFVIPALCEGKGVHLPAAVLLSVPSYLICLPVTGMATMFFTLVDTGSKSLASLNKRIKAIAVANSPKPFLVVSTVLADAPDPAPEAASESLTEEGLFSLRMVHYDLVEFLQKVMDGFQADILFFFLMAFCQNIFYYYSIVFNHKNILKDYKTLLFATQSLILGISLVINLWMICTGPNRIKDQLNVLTNNVSRLTAILYLPSDIMYELKIFQLQIRNFKPSFEVYGMFELSISLLFTMCASMVSYIVVLIQFAGDNEDIQYALNTSSAAPN